MLMNGARAVLESLKNEGVEIVFGYPGGAVLTLYDELYKMEFPHILTKHEQGAVHAADGYARATGKVGVCFATSGPGATNLITGIATAYMDSVPLVCFTGQVGNPYIGKDSFQEADIVGITTPVTKHNYLVKRAEDLPRVIKEAFFIARTGRPGPVVIDTAKDCFAKEFNYSYPKKVALRGYSGEFTGDEKKIDGAVKAIKKAKRPLIFFGGGVTLSDMTEEFRKIVKLTQIPVTTSLMGIGCADAADDCYLGMAGMHGSYAANMSIVDCDLLIGIGVRFDDRVTSGLQDFAPKAKIVHFEIDPAEINKNVFADYPVLGDLRWSLPLFYKRLKEADIDFKGKFADWRSKVRKLIGKELFPYKAKTKNIMPQTLIEKVSAMVDDDTIIVTDVGQHQMWAAQYYKAVRPRHFVTSGGLGTMGYGLPAALGAKIGNPKKKVVLFTGDGSIMMNCQEFATAADYGIDVKVVVLHNSVLGMVAQWQRLFYNRHMSQSQLKGHTDLVKLAEAMGVSGYRIEKPAELESILKKALKAKGAALIDVMIPEEANVWPMVPSGKRLDEMVFGGSDE